MPTDETAAVTLAGERVVNPVGAHAPLPGGSQAIAAGSAYVPHPGRARPRSTAAALPETW